MHLSVVQQLHNPNYHNVKYHWAPHQLGNSLKHLSTTAHYSISCTNCITPTICISEQVTTHQLHNTIQLSVIEQLHNLVYTSLQPFIGTPYISQSLNNCITRTTITATTTTCDRSNDIPLPPLKLHSQPSKFETSVQQEKDT